MALVLISSIAFLYIFIVVYLHLMSEMQEFLDQ